MAVNTLEQNINQVINDLHEIKSAIEIKGVEVPAGTPTRDYSEKILNIETGVDVSADTVVAAALRAGFTAHEASGAAITGIIQNYEGAIVSGATPGAQAKYEEGYDDGQASMPDLSKDTVTPDKLALGETAHDASGVQITGTLDTEAIRAEGYAEGEAAGIEAGKYDGFWDKIQDYGKLTNYDFFLAGKFWTTENFKPKYDIRPTSLYMFAFLQSDLGIDMPAVCEECGIVFDTSRCTNFQYGLGSSVFSRLGVIDARGADSLDTQMFSSATKLQTIEKLIVKETQKFNDYTFYGCDNLTALIVEGTIGQNGFNVCWSPLNKASLTSIINALSSTTTGLTVTLRLDAVNNAFETTAGAADGSTSEEWLTLAATKPNWTINLINS